MPEIIIDQLLSEVELGLMDENDLEALVGVLNPHIALKLYKYYEGDKGDAAIRKHVKDAINDLVYPIVLPALLKEQGINDFVAALKLSQLADGTISDLDDAEAKLKTAAAVRSSILPTYPIRSRKDYTLYLEAMSELEKKYPGKLYYSNQAQRIADNRALLIDRAQTTKSTETYAIIHRRVTVDMALKGIQYLREVRKRNIPAEERRKF